MAMNRALLVVIGLVCVLAEAANAGRVSKLLGGGGGSKSPAVSFNGLNKWLVKRLPHAEDLETNLAEVKNNLDELKSARVRRAAELFVAYVEANKCDDHLLATVSQIEAANVNLVGWKRVQKLMRSRTAQLGDLCGQYVDEAVEGVYQRSLANQLAPFLELMVFRENKRVPRIGLPDRTDWKGDINFFKYMVNQQDGHYFPTEWTWSKALDELAKGDPKAVVHETKADPLTGVLKRHYYAENFKYIYDKYLVEPCKTLDGALGHLLDGLYAMSRLVGKTTYDIDHHRQLITGRSNTVLQMLFGVKACRSLVGQDSATVKEIAKLLHVFTETDIQKTRV